MGLNQAYLFFIFTLTGILIGVVFDIFRILRRSFKTSDKMTYFQDILFWIITSTLLIYTIFKFNNGEIRSYVLFGITIGLAFYLMLFSKFVIKINVAIITFIKRIIMQVIDIILYPIKLLFKLIRKAILKPISFVFINIRKNIKTLCRNMSKFKIKIKFNKKKVKISE